MPVVVATIGPTSLVMLVVAATIGTTSLVMPVVVATIGTTRLVIPVVAATFSPTSPADPNVSSSGLGSISRGTISPPPWLQFGRDADGSDRSLLHAQPFCPLEIWPGSR